MKKRFLEILNGSYEFIERQTHSLFKRTPISYFDYSRCYDDGGMLTFSTSPDTSVGIIDQLPSRIELELFRMSAQRVTYMSHIFGTPPGVNLNNPDRMLSNIDHYAEAKIYHRIYFIDRIDDYYRIVGFGGSRESNSIFNFYLNNLSRLDQFIGAFERGLSSSILTSSKEPTIIVPYYNELPNISLQELLKDASLPSTPISEIFAPQPRSNRRVFTKREADCIGLIAKGHTMKSAAFVLGISDRTVEQHIRNAKDKNDICTKQQLIEMWHSTSGGWVD